MTDLRKAAEMALHALNVQTPLDKREFELRNAAIEALRQALAQPEEKMRIEGNGKLTTKPYPDNYESEHDFMKALAQPEQDPVAWIHTRCGHPLYLSFQYHAEDVPLYTAPPKHEWVGLTDEELKSLCDEWRIMYGEYVRPFAETIEAKLKEKNT